MKLSALAWRSLAHRRLRTVLTAVGVGVGVAVVTATLIANQASAESIGRAAMSSFGEADLRVRAFREEGFSPDAVEALQGLPGVDRSAAVSERRLLLSTLPGPDEQVFTLRVLGIDPPAEAALREHRLAEGSFVSASGASDAVVSAAWARDHGIVVGDGLLLTGSKEDTAPLQVVGLVDEHTVAPGEGVLFMNRSTLDAAFEVPAPVSYVDLGVPPGRADAVQAALDRVLVEPFMVETVDQVQARLARVQSGFSGMASLFGALALFVGAFLVYNTLAMTLVERTREIGLLRAAGTTSRQVLGLFLRQGLALGAAGSTLGVVLGIGVATIAIAVLDSTDTLLVTGLPLSPPALLFGYGMGVAVTLLAALVPAIQAARITPLAALRPSSQPGSGLWGRLRWLVLAEIAVAVIGLLLYPLDRERTPVGPVMVTLGLLLGAALSAAFLLEPIGRVVGRPFEWIFAAAGRLGRANLTRDRARTGLTVGAFMVGLATIVALGVVADTSRAAGRRWVESILPGGHAIRTAFPLDIELYRSTIETTPGTRAASPVVTVPATTERAGRRIELSLAGIDASVFQDNGSLVLVNGERAAAFQALRDGGAVLVPEPVARRDGLDPGDSVSVDTPAGPREFTVAGVVAYSVPTRSPDGALLISLGDAESIFGVNSASLWAMVPNGEMSDAAYAAAVDATAASLAAEGLTSRELAAELARSLDQLVAFFDVLALIAVLIGGLGIVNTLTVGVYERVREIGILRAYGMTGRQVQAMVVVEAAIMGAVGGVIAATVGLGVAWLGLAVGAGRNFGSSVSVPLPLMLGVLVLGILVAALGGIYPARLASRLSVIRSVQHQ